MEILIALIIFCILSKLPTIKPKLESLQFNFMRTLLSFSQCSRWPLPRIERFEFRDVGEVTDVDGAVTTREQALPLLGQNVSLHLDTSEPSLRVQDGLAQVKILARS